MITVVLVCGGRDQAATIEQRNHIYRTLNQIKAHYGEVMVLHGGAKGVDSYAGVWAEQQGVHCAVVAANWAKLGPSAGPLRNRAMLALTPTICVAFPGGKGTADMVRKARAAGIPTYEVQA